MTTLPYEEVKEEPEVIPEGETLESELQDAEFASTAAHDIKRAEEKVQLLSFPAPAAPRGEEHRHDSPGRLLSLPQALLPQDARQPAATEATHAAGQRVQEPDAAGRHQRVRDREGG